MPVGMNPLCGVCQQELQFADDKWFCVNACTEEAKSMPDELPDARDLFDETRLVDPPAPRAFVVNIKVVVKATTPVDAEAAARAIAAPMIADAFMKGQIEYAGIGETYPA